MKAEVAQMMAEQEAMLARVAATLGTVAVYDRPLVH